ncbi:MAG: excinuclease ABC subunit UvrA [Opitutaceae bacterium]|nr:excinuclease ABC subunit UvrA [Opitutaceae bacterium]
MAQASPESIRLRGVRQNNLKGFDLDVPLGKFIVVTGLSGTGKSSLVFETLHAEGQRRYVETFSAYTRQFLDLLAKPRVDAVENIRPSIAIKQSNTVKTSRSTVGTMTELTDYFKVWFSHVAECFDPETGEKVEDDNPQTIWAKCRARHADAAVLVCFRVVRPPSFAWAEILTSLKSQGYTRVLTPDGGNRLTLAPIEELLAHPSGSRLQQAALFFVLQDRLVVSAANQARFLEAVETALHFGHGEVHLFNATDLAPVGHYSRGLHSPATGRTFRAAIPSLFSFNSPLGACPKCRGFGRVIDIDYRLAIPDQSLSLDEGAIKPWEGEIYGESKRDLYVFARKKGIPTDVPFVSLSAEQKDYVVRGEPGYGENGRDWPKYWYGLKGFFRYLETKTYKMHVRVFLSRYRAYNSCPACGGARLQPEALCWRWQGHTLPQLYQMPVGELLALVQTGGSQSARVQNASFTHQRDLALDSIITRLRYLEQVGLGYLTLDRTSRTLSGGEVERVNLTSCLGTSLVDTLFVLDEPSVGLHPRDLSRLIGIIRNLTDAGNTVVVVEHDEDTIRSADHVIEIGPEPGARGGTITFQGSVAAMLRAPACITGDYLSGRQRVAVPERRRSVHDAKWLHFTGVTKHNLRGLSFRLPLQRFVCLSGVSGSGKSTLLDNVIYQGLLTQRNQLAEDPALVAGIRSDLALTEVVLVDQSPLSRTPRSNPALYCGAWEPIRELYAATPAAETAGFNASSFSFNSGDGRCDHCQGLGSERVELQFLTDVFVPCPVCEGRRFKSEVLAITWKGKSIAELLATTITDALPLFTGHSAIQQRLAALDSVGLGYLPLGQPLNTLSGGEAQRLKLVRYLGDLSTDSVLAPGASRLPPAAGALLLLDEPTTGLHRHDVKRLLEVLQRIVARGHSIIVIEHNLDVLKSADWLVEIGPEAGALGGRIVAEGTPEDLARVDAATSPFLRRALGESNLLGYMHSELAAAEAPATYQTGLPLGGSELSVLGARENNLKNISVSIPHRQFSVVTGVSGSGKSTLAFDIIFAEGQRRFMESMSPYARQFVEQLPRPDIDRLSGIPPTVAIEQRATRGTRKSTVATITEVAQYLRLLYARLGVQHHPDTDREITPLSPSQLRKLFRDTLASPPARGAKHLYLCAPLIRGRKGHHQPIATWLAKKGYELMRADGRLLRVENFQKLDRYKDHYIDVVVADLGQPPGTKSKLEKTKWSGMQLDRALDLGHGACFLLTPTGEKLAWFSTTRTDLITGESFPELDPKHFSFNSPRGWCPACRGHGRIYDWMRPATGEEAEELPPEVADALRVFDPDNPEADGQPCPVCHGERLNRVARAVRLHFKKGRQLSLPALLRLTPDELLAALRDLRLDARGRLITQDIVPQIEERLCFLRQVGLEYLSLDRPTITLSGGEAQRIRLAAQLGSNLSGVLYVLDEPSIGLHARDNERLIESLQSLRAQGNTLLVVEHDETVMERADRIIDLGPGAGINGGQVVANDTPANLRKIQQSLTGLYLDQGIPHPLRGSYRPVAGGNGRARTQPGKPAASRLAQTSAGDPGWLTLTGVRYRNLQEVDLRLPLSRLIMVCGPSGAGKSTLFRDVLHPAVTCAIKRKLTKLPGREFLKRTRFDDGGGMTSPHAIPRRRGHPPSSPRPSPPFEELRNAQLFKNVIEVDQAPIGKTPRSTPATYLGIFDLIRKFFASLPEAKIRGFTASRFSFNTAGGRCETCAGAGRIKLEMAFMPDSYLPCETCGGLRYSADLSDITWKGRTIGQVLQLSFDEAAVFFDFHARLREICQLMVDCGLGYLTLGQSSPTLSGGEAQRLKLVSELAHGLPSYTERSCGLRPRNLYLLEEPTIGLHSSDCEKLILVLHSLVDQGHTVVVIEHHLDLLAEADWLVELGPGGGPAGGRILYQGPLAGILKVRRSPTAPYLIDKLGRQPSARLGAAICRP